VAEVFTTCPDVSISVDLEIDVVVRDQRAETVRELHVKGRFDPGATDDDAADVERRMLRVRILIVRRIRVVDKRDSGHGARRLVVADAAADERADQGRTCGHCDNSGDRTFGAPAPQRDAHPSKSRVVDHVLNRRDHI